MEKSYEPIEMYQKSTTGQQYHLVKDQRDGSYKVRYRSGRFGPLETLTSFSDNREDAEQFLVGLFEANGYQELADEVLEP